MAMFNSYVTNDQRFRGLVGLVAAPEEPARAQRTPWPYRHAAWYFPAPGQVQNSAPTSRKLTSSRKLGFYMILYSPPPEIKYPPSAFWRVKRVVGINQNVLVLTHWLIKVLVFSLRLWKIDENLCDQIRFIHHHTSQKWMHGTFTVNPWKLRFALKKNHCFPQSGHNLHQQNPPILTTFSFNASRHHFATLHHIGMVQLQQQRNLADGWDLPIPRLEDTVGNDRIRTSSLKMIEKDSTVQFKAIIYQLVI